MNSPSSPVSTDSRTDVNLLEAQFRARVDHARVHAQALGVNHAHAFGRHDFGADIGDLPVLDQHRDALHLRRR